MTSKAQKEYLDVSIEADTIVAGAIAWHVRQRDMTDHEWLEFTEWLEASPAHACAYDAVASQDRALGDVSRLLTPAKPLAPPALQPRRGYGAPARSWRWAGGGAIAAALAVMLAVPQLRHANGAYTVETRPGETRTLKLNDGTTIEMNGGTRLRLDHGDQRVAQLDTGEAVFHVRHDAANPFTVSSGALSVQDMGTVFDIARDGSRLDVAVAEGSVAFQPGANAVRLSAGQALSAREDLGGITRAAIAPETVGGWRSGRLSFVDAPLATVASAFERRYGTRIVMSTGLPDRSFSGMIQLSGSADRDIPHLAALIGAGWSRDADRWVLSAEGSR